jgi:uncharacterized protein DUF4410
MRYVVAALAIGVVCAAAAPVTVRAQGTPVQTVKDGVLDEIKLFSAKLPATKVVVMRPFSATDADLTEGDKKEETKKMQAIAPGLLADEFVAKVKTMGAFTEAAVLTGDTPPDAIVVEGKFREMDPGSRAKRYFVGYGAGKSGVMVEGTVKSADGTVLATFQQRRVGVMGMAGGDSMEKMKADTATIGEDIAKFLSAWATGKKLK